MRMILLAAGVAALALGAAAQANAAEIFSFTGGNSSPSAGYTVIDNFDTTAGLTGTYQLKVPPADGSGAPPAFASPGGSYLSVLGGDSATYTFATPVTSFEYDWGSVDSYNTLTVDFVGGGTATVTGADIVNPANGDQTLATTNGLFQYSGTNQIAGITLTSSQNSFEIDNLAIPSVPEPATWGLMLIGIGGIGAAMRTARRRNAAVFATA